MQKTIAISANTSWYLYNFRKNTITALLAEGYQVIAIAPPDEYSDKLRALGAQFIAVAIDQGGTNVIKDLTTLWAFYRIFKQNKVDVLLNFTPKNNIYATLAASRFSIRCINNIAGLGMIFIHPGITAKIAQVLYKISQRYAHTIFFQNEDDRALFLQNKLADSRKTDRLPGSGVDLTRFVVQPANDDGVVRFLLIARMLFDKGVGIYVDAARQIKARYGDAVEFQLLGFLGVNNPSAVSVEQMQAWCDEGIVHYLGVSDQVESVIAQADCVVLPSYYREGVPKSLLEAAAMGKPLITTDNIGCRETVDDGVNGFLCQMQSVESLVEVLEKMLNLSHAQRLQMGEQSRKKIAREFDERVVIEKYLQAIKAH